MPANYLEQLIAEWYEYKGYFVRRNVLVGKRPKGGYECELDIVAFHPGLKHLVQIEPSMDADSWAIREKRYRKKFDAGRNYIPTIFRDVQLPDTVEQIVVLVFASRANHERVGGGRLVLVDEILEDIFREFRGRHLDNNTIPEHLTILRTCQFVAEYRNAVLRGLNDTALSP